MALTGNREQNINDSESSDENQDPEEESNFNKKSSSSRKTPLKMKNKQGLTPVELAYEENT